MDPVKDRQRCRLDRPAQTFVPVPETAWTAASRHFFRTVMTNRGCIFEVQDTTPQSKCRVFRCRSDFISRYVRIAKMHRDLILDLGGSGLNPCADARGLAGAMSSSAWPSADGSSDHILAELGRPRPIIRK